MIRRKNFYVRNVWFLLFFAGLALAGLTVASFNWRGYCWQQSRFLSEADKIDAAIEYAALGSRKHFFKVRMPDGGTENGDIEIDLYPTMEAFHAANPDCCRLNPEDRSLPPHTISLAQRLLNLADDWVEITFTRRTVAGEPATPVEGDIIATFVDGTVHAIEERITRIYEVGACGEIY